MKGDVLVPEIEAIQYQNFMQFSEQSQHFLIALAKDRDRLNALIENVLENEKLLTLSRHYATVDKLVLAERSDGQVQLRLHIYPAQRERITHEIDVGMKHNHRWSFSSLILLGGYQHILYGVDPETSTFVPACIRHEKEGSVYSLHHSQYHSIEGEAGSITLIMKGPQEKERFQVADGQRCVDAPVLKDDFGEAMSKERCRLLVTTISHNWPGTNAELWQEQD